MAAGEPYNLSVLYLLSIEGMWGLLLPYALSVEDSSWNTHSLIGKIHARTSLKLCSNYPPLFSICMGYHLSECVITIYSYAPNIPWSYLKYFVRAMFLHFLLILEF